MNTTTDFPAENDVQVAPTVEWQLADNSPNFHFRSMFRPKLMEFFELTNKKHGAYLWAEQKTKEWFKDNYAVPFSAWHYRNIREKIAQE